VELNMVLGDSIRARRRGLAAIVAAAMFTALAPARAVPAWAAPDTPAPLMPMAEPPRRPEPATTPWPCRKGKTAVGIRGHGFVADHGVFTTIDAPDAGPYTVAFGIDESGRIVGGYVDVRGRLHGFLKDDAAFTVIDFTGAAATLVSKINAQGHIVGAYSNEPNTPALSLPHGFLLHDGVFTPIDVPGATVTQPFGINNRGQIVGFY
jgi:hypothetical protein